MEVSPEKEEKESEKDVGNGKTEPTLDESCWIYEPLSCILHSSNYG